MTAQKCWDDVNGIKQAPANLWASLQLRSGDDRFKSSQIFLVIQHKCIKISYVIKYLYESTLCVVSDIWGGSIVWSSVTVYPPIDSLLLSNANLKVYLSFQSHDNEHHVMMTSSEMFRPVAMDNRQHPYIVLILVVRGVFLITVQQELLVV